MILVSIDLHVEESQSLIGGYFFCTTAFGYNEARGKDSGVLLLGGNMKQITNIYLFRYA